MKLSTFLRTLVAFPTFMASLCIAVTCTVVPVSVRTAEARGRWVALDAYDSSIVGTLPNGDYSLSVPYAPPAGDATVVQVDGVTNTANFTFFDPPASSVSDSIGVGTSTNSANVSHLGIDVNSFNRRTGGVTNVSDSNFQFDFELDVDMPFALSGFFHSTSASPAHGAFDVSLLDLTNGVTVFDLPGSGNLADFLRTLSIPSGTLSANTEYLFSTDAHIDNSAGDVDQLASSEFFLAFDPAPVPEPASVCLLGAGGLLVLRRRRR